MTHRALPAVAASFLLGAALAASARAAVPTLAPDQLRPGQKAIVRTVFEGTRVDSFEAVIVGVTNTGRVSGDMILARATSERVVQSGVAQGMSGSPVYVDGRLIGALSSGWSFSKEPLFGVTPIGEMLPVFDQPVQPDVDGTAGPGGIEGGARLRGLSCGGLRWEGDEDPDPETFAAPPAAGFHPLGLPLAAGGLDPRALANLAPFYRSAGLSVVPGGQAAAGTAPTTLEPGSAVAVDVMRGDLQLAAIGTVTYRDGDRVLIFGHPFFAAGEVRLPLATAVITTIVASEETSFKIGQRGVEVGVATQDRRTAVGGVLGRRARLMPFAVDVERAGAGADRFRFETIEDRALAPLLCATAAVNSVLESGGAGPSQTLRWTLRLYRRGVPPLVLSDVIASDSPVQDMGGAVLAPLRFLLNNPFERCILDSATVRVEATPARHQWTLRSARLLEAAVRAGQTAHVRCELESWRGERRSVDLELTVPEEAPDGGYVLHLGGATELTRYEAQHLAAHYRATSLDDAWRRLAVQRSADGLYATLYAGAPEITRRGTDYPELPVSALALLSGGGSAGDLARRGDVTVLDSRRLPVDGPLRGELLLTINVDRKAP